MTKWVEKSLGELCDLQNGYAFKSKDYVDSSSTLNIRMSNIRPSGKFDADHNIKYLPDSYADKYQKFLLSEGDLLVAMTDMAGEPKILGLPTIVKDKQNRGMLLNQRVGKLCNFSSDVYKPFLCYILGSPAVMNFYKGKGAGQLQINLSKEDILSAKLKIPPISEQKRIAAILDKADELRQKRRQSIAKLDELLQATFLDMFGDPVTNPMGWEVSSLESISSSIENGISPSSKGSIPINVLTLSSITQGSFVGEKAKLGMYESKPSSSKFVTGNKFLVCRGNGNKKLVGLGHFPDKEMTDTLFPDTMIALKVSTDKVSPHYFEMIWNSPLIRNYLEGGARTTNGTFKVNQTLLSNAKILLPPIDLQRAFDEKYRLIRNQRKLYLKCRDNLLFSSLQQRAFKGQL